MTDNQVVESILDRTAELLGQRIGLREDSTLRGRLRRAVRDEATEHGQDLSTYFDTVALGGDALQGLLNRVTVQETAFFRHPQHFQTLARDILPALPRPVTIWSAGCANGQEPFSLAMLLEEQGIDGRVIATDISTAALKRTMAARYTGRELAGLSPERIAGHLTPAGETWRVNKPIQDRVTTLQHNLLESLPTEVLACQVVFCRNVIIYLSPEHASAFLDRIADALPSASSLFLGAAETIWPISARFQAIPAGDTFIYRQPVIGTGAMRRLPGDWQTSTTEAVPSGFPSIVTPTAIAAANAKPRPRSPGSAPELARSAAAPGAAEAAALGRAGQDAMAGVDYDAAVIAFRKCAYLTPHDPMAQLHLGLALEAAGDRRSAQRAYAATRSALAEVGVACTLPGIEGIATAELIRLLDSKQRETAR
jgi:chemotaxis methyl-accepting protein methylase